MPRPSVKPEWAITTQTLPTARTPNKLQPSEKYRTQGFDLNDYPEAQEENFWRNNVYLWIVYIDEILTNLDADTLDGIDSTEFWQKAEDVDAAFLDGVAKAGYWLKSENVDALTLDGQPASVYLGGDADTLGGQPPATYLNGNAQTLNSQPASFYLDGNSQTLNGQPASFYLNNDGGDADTLNGQPGSYYLDNNGAADTIGGLSPDAFVKKSEMLGSPAAAGIQRFHNGLIMQWGRIVNVDISGTGFTNITYPVTFPTAVIQVQVSEALENGGSVSNKILSLGSDGEIRNNFFRVYGTLPNGSFPTLISPFWFAIGY